MELEAGEQLPGGGAVPLPTPEVLRSHVEIQVGYQPHQLAVQEHLLPVGGQVLPEFGGEIVQVLVYPLQGAIGGDQAGGGLLPHPGHPGQVVGGVSPQRRIVDIPVGGDAVAFLDVGGVGQHDVGDPPPGVENPDVVVDELEGVPVPGDHEHVPTPGLGPPSQGGDHVVGFVSLPFDLDDPEGVQHLADEGELALEGVGGRLTLRLVVGVFDGAEGFTAHVPGDGQGVGVMVGEQLDEHPGEAVHRVGHLAGGGGQLLGQGEERPVGDGVAVDEGEGGHRHRQ